MNLQDLCFDKRTVFTDAGLEVTKRSNLLGILLSIEPDLPKVIPAGESSSLVRTSLDTECEVLRLGFCRTVSTATYQVEEPKA